MQMAMKMVEMRIMWRARPSSHLVPWTCEKRENCSRQAVALPQAAQP
jgi:hypothetical protein